MGADTAMRITTANLNFFAGGNKQYVEHLCGVSDVLLLQEVKDVSLEAMVPEGWQVWQDTSSQDRANSAICVGPRYTSTGFRLRLSTHPHGAELLTRWLATCIVASKEGLPMMAGSVHFAPARFRWLWDGQIGRTRRAVNGTTRPMVLGVDANMNIHRLAAKLGMRAHGQGIIGVLVTAGVHVRGVKVDRTPIDRGWSDHPSVTIVAGFGRRVDAPREARRYIRRLEKLVKQAGQGLPKVR